MNSLNLNCNLHVVSHGAPRVHQSECSGTILMRNISIEPTVIVHNLLASEIEFKLCKKSATEPNSPNNSDIILSDNFATSSIPTYKLFPGENKSFMDFHALEDLNLSIKLLSVNNTSRIIPWSKVIYKKK